MRHLRKPFPVHLVLALLIVVSSAACSSTAAPTTAPVIAATSTNAPATAVPATEVPPPTATLAPTATPVPPTLPPPAPPGTATPVPTSQPTFGSAGEFGLSAWCLPENVSVAALQKPLEPPVEARVGETGAEGFEIRNLPVTACVFAYTFNQPVPEGLTLQVYELRGKQPWLTAELTQVEGKPETVIATLRHTYIVAPPLWDVSYQFAVVNASGQEVRRDTVNLHRWTPELCWNGRRPNPITLRCPLPLDLHPWDAGYGTPIPTFPPEEDDD